MNYRVWGVCQHWVLDDEDRVSRDIVAFEAASFANSADEALEKFLGQEID